MAALINGVPSTPDAFGVLRGTDGTDKIAGTSGNDKIAGGKGVDWLYGGEGSDTFMFKLSDFDSSLGRLPQDYIHDFGGAGNYTAGNNDFLHFSGFGAGSKLIFDEARTDLHIGYGYDPLVKYYNIYSGATGQTFVLSIKSLNGNVINENDYNFY